MSVTGELGQWAEFNCTMACTHSICWYMEGYHGEVSETCTAMFQEENVKVCKELVQPCQDLTSSHGYTGTLRVLVTEEMASSSIAVQCGGVASIFSEEECPPIIVFSSVSYLNGTSLIDQGNMCTHTQTMFSFIPLSLCTVPVIPVAVPSLPTPSPVVCLSVVQG